MADKSDTPDSVAAGNSDQFTLRVREVVGDEKVRQFARRASMGATTLQNILDGARPTVEKLVAIARAGGVTVDWLATGEGPMRRGDNQPAGMAEEPAVYRGPIVDEVMVSSLRVVVEMVLTRADQVKKRPSNQAIAEAIVELCRMEIEARRSSTSMGIDGVARVMERLSNP